MTNSALQKALAITQQPMGNLQLIDWKLGHLEIVAQCGFSTQFLHRFRVVKKTDDCACGRAFRLRQTVLIDDVAEDPAFALFRKDAREAGFRSVQSTPIISRSGAFLGVISTHGNGIPNPEQVTELKTLARHTADQLIWLRSRIGTSTVPPVNWPSTHRIYTVHNPDLSLDFAREALARSSELLAGSTPDTFLGKRTTQESSSDE